MRDDASVRELDGRITLQSALDHLLLHLLHAFGPAEPPPVPFTLVLPRRGGQRRVEEERREPDVKVEGEVFFFLGQPDRFLDAALADEAERANRVCIVLVLHSQ